MDLRSPYWRIDRQPPERPVLIVTRTSFDEGGTPFMEHGSGRCPTSLRDHPACSGVFRCGHDRGLVANHTGLRAASRGGCRLQNDCEPRFRRC